MSRLTLIANRMQERDPRMVYTDTLFFFVSLAFVLMAFALFESWWGALLGLVALSVIAGLFNIGAWGLAYLFRWCDDDWEEPDYDTGLTGSFEEIEHPVTGVKNWAFVDRSDEPERVLTYDEKRDLAARLYQRASDLYDRAEEIDAEASRLDIEARNVER